MILMSCGLGGEGMSRVDVCTRANVLPLSVAVVSQRVPHHRFPAQALDGFFFPSTPHHLPFYTFLQLFFSLSLVSLPNLFVSLSSSPPSLQPADGTKTVLIELDWDLAMVVPAHFLEAVLAVTGGGTFPHDDVGDRPWSATCASQLRKLSCYLHSICLQDANIATRMPPSQLAAAIIATARLQLNIYPVWPAELHVATGYSCDRLGPAMSKVLQLYKELLPAAGGGGGAGAGASADVNAIGEVWLGPTDVGMMESVMRTLEQQNGPRGKHEYHEGSRETMTPSPTGPLESGGFFNMMEH